MLRTALLGAGGFGRRLARQVADHPEARLSAVVDIDAASLDRVADECGLDEQTLYTDSESMYAGTALDAVVVATPPALHADQIHDALDRGLHVLCEKPVVVDGAAAERLRDRVAGSESTFMAGYQRHLSPAYLAVRERYADGERDPAHVVGELTQDWTHHFESGTNWRTDPEVGGRGHLFSVGTHVVESVLWATGLTPTAVSAEMDFHDDGEQIDRRASLTVRFASGAVATFADSAVAPVAREHVRFWDAAGACYVDAADWGDQRLTVVEADGTERRPDLDEEARRGKFAAFVDAVETGADPPATARDVHRVTALLDAAYESARTGERVAVDLD